jgi:hypothetical protein
MLCRFILLSMLLTATSLFANPGVVLAQEASRCEVLFQGVEVKTVSARTWRHYDQYQNFNYGGFQKILFLNDAGVGGRLFENSPQAAGRLVVSSDFQMSPGVTARVDNNNLPFRSNSFDLIVMNRGLCPCHSAVACGGIDTKREPMKKFLQNAIQILDKNNPRSLALFTGFYFPGLFRHVVPELWISIVNEIQAEIQTEHPNLQIAILHMNSTRTTLTDGGFIGIAVSADPVNSISERLTELNPALVE